jgi:pSer/pThr/pTyr-binding forkhead associated (FHA) protein
MDYQLVVVRGRSASKTLKLANGITTVGRHDECQLRIGSSQVSRKHCQLFEQNGRLLVIDLGSSNGTFVNGKKIEGTQVLKPGDVLGLGKVKFRVEKLDGTGAPKPSDTAVAIAADAIDDSGDSEEFEIDFDDDVTTKGTDPAAAPAKDETVKEKTAKEETVKAQAAKKEKAEIEMPQPASSELGEDAVADFLLNIDLDDEDKR